MFWFRQKYSLPPGHPLLMRLTMEDIETEYWACHYSANPSSESAEDDDWDTEEILRAIEDGDVDAIGEWETVIDE